MKEAETEKYHQLKSLPGDEGPHSLIGFKNGTFTWGVNSSRNGTEPTSAFTLRDLNVNFVPGRLNIIAGPTGSGKTSMLMALLGEMTLLEGRVYLPGSHSREDLYPNLVTGLTESVAYCAQQAYVFKLSSFSHDANSHIAGWLTIQSRRIFFSRAPTMSNATVRFSLLAPLNATWKF